MAYISHHPPSRSFCSLRREARSRSSSETRRSSSFLATSVACNTAQSAPLRGVEWNRKVGKVWTTILVLNILGNVRFNGSSPHPAAPAPAPAPPPVAASFITRISCFLRASTSAFTPYHNRMGLRDLGCTIISAKGTVLKQSGKILAWRQIRVRFHTWESVRLDSSFSLASSALKSMDMMPWLAPTAPSLERPSPGVPGRLLLRRARCRLNFNLINTPWLLRHNLFLMLSCHLPH